MTFLDCPAYLDQDGAPRCGLPAEVRRRFTMRSTGGPLEAATIRRPAGHWFTGPVGSLTWEPAGRHDPGTAAAASTARRSRLPRSHQGPDSTGGPASRDFPAKMQQKIRRPDGAPAYYLGRPARLWITALRPCRSRTASRHLRPAVTDGGNGHRTGAAARSPAPGAAGSVPPALIASRAAAGDPNSAQGTTT